MKKSFTILAVLISILFSGLLKSQTVEFTNPDKILHLAAEDSSANFGLPLMWGGFQVKTVLACKVNSDSFEDLIIYAPGGKNLQGEIIGKVYIYFGSANGVSTSPSQVIDGLRVINDVNPYGQLMVGDFNNDENIDLVVGYESYNRQSNFTQGYAICFFGKTDGSGIDTNQKLIIDGQSNHGSFTHTMEKGDFNQDGIDDLLIGALHDGGYYEGRIYCYYGGSSFDAIPDVTFSRNGSTVLGCTAIKIADVNNDSFDDIITSDIPSWNPCAVTIDVFMGDNNMNTQPAYVQGLDGMLCLQVGDINGDGYNDIMGTNGNGMNCDGTAPYHFITVIKGSANYSLENPLLIPFEGQVAIPSNFANSVDVNNDGINDVFLTITKDDGTKESYIFAGHPTQYINLTDTLYKFVDTDNSYGSSIENIIPADCNGDGKPEFYGYSQMAPYKNVIFVYENLPKFDYSSLEIFTTGLNVPNQIVFDSSGNLFVANHSYASYSGPFSNTIAKIDTTGEKSVFVSGYTWPSGIAIDKQENIYFTQNNASYNITKVTPQGNAATFANLNHRPGPITIFDNFVPDSFAVFTVSHWNPYGIIKTSINGSHVSFNQGRYMGCEISNDGKFFFVTDGFNNKILRFNTVDGTSEDWVTILRGFETWPSTIGPDYKPYFIARSLSDTTRDAVFRINGFNDVSEIINNMPIESEFNDLAFKRNGDFYDLYISEVAWGYRMSPDSNRIIVFPKILVFQKPPTVNAGIDATICADGSMLVEGEINSAVQDIFWMSEGDGYFEDEQSLTTVYYPGQLDITNGNVLLCLNGLPTDPDLEIIIDCMLLSFQETPIAEAGVNATICQTGTHVLSGYASYYTTILWSTSGNGTFSNPGNLNAVYTPGNLDINNGVVYLTLTANGLGTCATSSAIDSKTLTIQKSPTANAGTDATICETGTASLTGTAQNHSSVLWTTSGTGTFSSTSSLTSVYTPSTADKTAGTVTLTLTAAAVTPCTISATDTKILTIQKTPIANAGTDATICETGTASLTGTAQNHSSVLWTTSGTGTFSSTTILNPVYTPGTSDITAGTVTLTLTASAVSPCTVSSSDTKILTIQKSPTANAGVDATVCQGSTHTLAGTAQNQSSVLWSTSGTGTFSSTTILNPVYTLGATDITAGTVTLTLTASAISPCTVSATDTKILIIQKTPTANAGVDATVCQGSTHTLAGTAQNQSSVLWTTSGNGTFSSTTILNPVYTLGATDITAGTVTLTLTASAISPCTVSATDTKILIIQKTPTANAGTDATICETGTASLTGTAQNHSSVLWTTSGSGTFSSTSSLTSVYTPGANDISVGTVNLTITASPISPCTISSEDAKTLVIQKTTSANTGNDVTICQGSTHQLSGTAQNYSTVTWSTSGTGTFSSTSSLTPVYAPSTADITSGTVTLTITATAVSPCTVSVNDTKILVIQKTPTANAGIDATICQGSTHTLAGTATNQGTVAWTTSGNGTFSSTTILNPVYTPGATDITAGTVTLTLTASAISPCTVSATDTKILIIQKTPTANAGVDATVCQGSTHTLAGTAQNQNTVLWTTSGTGTFSSTTILNPVYTPGATDITAGTVTLTLTTSAISPCTVSATDTKILVIQKTPTANAGTDATICQGSTHTLAGTASNQGTVAWTTSGNGSFSSTTILTPIYTPGATDISAGTVTLTLTTSAISPCTVSATDTKILVIQKTPTANAGTDATICQGSTHTLAGTATNQASVLWTTSGNGTFSATNSLTPVYTPGTTDVTAGTVTLTLTAAAVTPCTVSSSDQKILTIQKSPTANAGIDATVCQGSTHTLAGTAQNQSSVLWTTSGTGTFSSTSSLASIYTPGVADITAGTVTLTLTASALSPCTVSATDTKILTIQKTPTAYAGVDATICQGSSHALAGTAQNQNTVLWTTSGTGTFSSTSSLASIYTPGVADITAGTVTLTLTASAISPCTVSGTDTKILTIQKTPTANAGIDATINQGSIHQLLGSAQYQTNVLWTTSGDGTFSSTSSLTPVYNPGATDIAAGNVQLCINATPVSPCVLADTDCLILTILQQENLLLRIPTDVTIGQNETGLIPIILENPNSVEIEAFDLVIHYNSAYINISNVLLTGGVLENQNYISQINTSFPGQVIIILYAGGNLFSGEGVICYLSASAPGAVGACSDLDLTMAQINEEDVLVTNGQVCIIQTLFDITGNVGYFGNSNPVSDVLLTLTGDGNYSATTNPDGLYQYSSVLRGDYISTPSKNNDLGGLSGTDASRIARYPAGLFTLNCMEQIAADVSLNGSISGVDASRVARYSAGLITELNPEIKNWVFTPENIASCPNWPPIGWIDNRTYTDINADLTGQDFTAVRLGDVTGNWAPDSKFKDETFTQGERKAEYNPSADSIQLLVYLNEPLSIEGVDITLEYDASKLKFVNAGFESSIFEGSDYEMQVKESTGGKLKMVIYALGDLYFGDGVLTKITFAVTSETTKPARVALTSLSVNEYRVKGWLALQNEPFGHQFKTEALSIVPDVESSLMAVYPNPFQNKTCISYYLKEQSQVTVQITDINGKLVTTLANEVQNEGIKELWWNGDNDQKQQLPQGVYFAVFKSENSFEVKRIVLIR